MFLDGSPNCKTHFAHRQLLSHDDYLEIEMPIKFALQASPEPNNSTNAFFIQLSPPQVNAEADLGSDMTSMFGLVISLFGTNNVGNGTYVVTHRFFAQETLLNREYFSVLADNRDKLQGCVLPNLSDISRLLLRIDIENAKEIEVLLEEAGTLKTCLKVPNIHRFFLSKGTTLSLKAFSGALNKLRVEVGGLTLREKRHSFDIDDDLEISHALVEEIFEKVATFTDKFNADKDKLASIYELQQDVSAQSSRLELYAIDLFKGTKKFQEFMLETLAYKKVYGIRQMPKLMKIRNKIDELTRVQKAVFDRFMAIQVLLDSKKIIKKSFRKLVRMQEVMLKIKETVADARFDEVIQQSRRMLEIASKGDVREVLQLFADLKDDLSHSATLGIGAGFLVFGVFFLVTFAFLIIRKIIAVEKSHFT